MAVIDRQHTRIRWSELGNPKVEGMYPHPHKEGQVMVDLKIIKAIEQLPGDVSLNLEASVSADDVVWWILPM